MVLQLRVLVVGLQVFAGLFTWANQKVVDIYLITAPCVFISFAVIVSAYIFSYSHIKKVTGEDVPDADFDKADEYAPAERVGIMQKSNLSLISNLVLIIMVGTVS